MAQFSNVYRPENNPLAVSPGDFRHEIRIENPSSTRDAAGQPVQAWDQLLVATAKIENTSGASYRSSFSNNVLASESTDMISVRWPGPDVTIKAGMRVIFGDNTFLIQAVDNVLRRNRIVRMACMQIAADSN